MQIHVRDNPRAGRRPHVAATTAGSSRGDAGTIPYRTVPEHTIPEPGMLECGNALKTVYPQLSTDCRRRQFDTELRTILEAP